MGGLRVTAFLMVSLVVGSASTTRAADLYGYPGIPNCSYVESATALLRTGSVRILREQLYSRYHHAIHVFHSAVYSAGPAFVWANETKIACAKAIGYLKLGHFRREINVEMIQKCECFHARMVWYLGHPGDVGPS
jgi:hypothetical protein